MRFSLLPDMLRRSPVPATSPPIDLRGFEAKPKAPIRAVDSYLHKYGADPETRNNAEAVLKATDFDWMVPVAAT